jgi:hypothetical protein
MKGRPRGERRAEARLSGAQCPVAAARLRPGGEVRVLDLSAIGTAIDRAPRLLPGSMVQLHLSAPGWRATVAALVVRCEVSDLSDTGARYRAGLRFDRPLETPGRAAGSRGP